MSPARVMIVEDEVVTAMALGESARRLGYDVIATVDTGEQAVEMARNHHLDVILMDVQLRGEVDGIAAAEIIRNETHVPSIILTAYSDAATIKRAKIGEPGGYLVKPYNEKELRAAIELAVHKGTVERDRRDSQDAIRSRDRTLTDLIDNSPAIIYLKDSEGRYTLVNRRFEEVFNVRRADVRGKEDREVLSEADLESLGPHDADVLKSGPTSHLEHEIIRPDGVHYYVAVRFSVRDPGGSPYGVCGILTDITEFKRAEAALHASEARYRLIAETTMDVISLSRADGTIEYISPSCRRFIGYSPEELIGRTLDHLVHPDDLGQVIQRSPATSENWVAAPMTFRIMDRGGGYLWAESRSQAFPGGDAEGPLVLSVMRDVTEQVVAEQERERLNAALESRMEERMLRLGVARDQKDTIAHSVSHDIREPVHGIAKLAEALERDHANSLSPEARAIIERIRAESHRVAVITDELLGSTLTAPVALHLATLDLSDVATRVAEDMRRSEPARQTAVSITPGLTARCDPTLMPIALGNLIGNAWRATANTPRGEVSFGAAVDADGRRAFFVHDNGIGFEASAAHRLFEPFARTRDEVAPPSAGMGLASVRTIIERHGGRVWAEGKPGEGATFWFTLPAREGSTPAA